MPDTRDFIEQPGEAMHALATELFPFNRSITGDGVRKTLRIIMNHLPDLVIHETPTGTPAFDWTVPQEWSVSEAYLEDSQGNRIVDFQDSNLHIVNYSTFVDVVIDSEELDEHLYSLPNQPMAIPYVTSYYAPNWGFCLQHDRRVQLEKGQYRAFIGARHFDGSLTYGELRIPGASDQEVFISTYICHPSLGNNELSGPVVATALAQWISQLPQRRFSYRFVFVPESIGALVYTSQNLDELKRHVVAGFNLTCIGDDGDYSYLASRRAGTRIDEIARYVVGQTPQPRFYSYLDRGSDERTYCAPGIDLPLVSIMRTKYGEYPEYHTSLDDLSVITPAGLSGGLKLVRDCIEILESDMIPEATVRGEPQLGRRGLYHDIHGKVVEDVVLMRTHVLAYADGDHSLFDIARLLGKPFKLIRDIAIELESHSLLTLRLPPDVDSHSDSQ